MDNNEPWEIAKMGDVVNEYPYSYMYIATTIAKDFTLRIVETEDSKIIYAISRFHNPKEKMLQKYSLDWSDKEILKDQYENIFSKYFDYGDKQLYNPWMES